MISRNTLALLSLTLWVLIVSACAPQQPGVPVTADTPVAGTTPDLANLPPQAVLDAQQWLADSLSVALEGVEIVETEQVEWTDSCLGLGQPNESCLQAVTPGWRVILEISGQQYEVRTDRSGSSIRLATP